MQQKNVSQAVLCTTQLTLHIYDSSNTSRRFALGASNVCLVGENPTCSVLALQGWEGLWLYTTTAMHDMTTFPPNTASHSHFAFHFHPQPMMYILPDIYTYTRRSRQKKRRAFTCGNSSVAIHTIHTNHTKTHAPPYVPWCMLLSLPFWHITHDIGAHTTAAQQHSSTGHLLY